MIVLGMAVGDLQLPLSLTGFAVSMGMGGIGRRYIPNALKMVTELYHSTANPTKIAGTASHAQLGRGRLICGSEKCRSFFFPACWMLFWISSRVVDTSFANTDICTWKYYGLTPFNLTLKRQYEEFFGTVGLFVGVINYDLIFRREELRSLKNFTLVLDESSCIQNETAKRSKFILKMQPKNVVLLSGTPTAGKYEKLWSQLHLLGWGISKKLYYQQYVEMEWIEDQGSGFRIPHVTGYKNVDRLKAKLAAHGAFFLKTEDVLTLPKQVFIPIETAPASCYSRFIKDSYD